MNDFEEPFSCINSQLKIIIRDLINDALANDKRFSQHKMRIEALEATVQAQAIGLQNVYDQFSKLTDAKFLADWNAQKESWEKSKQNMKLQIADQLNIYKEYYASLKKVNNIIELSEIDDALVARVAKVCKTFEDIDE